MTKIFCPVAGCNESRFGAKQPTQQHINRHLHKVHSLKVTASNIFHYRRKQDEAYQKRRTLISIERSRVIKKMKEQFDEFAKDPSLPLSEETLSDDVDRQYMELMDVESDSDRAEDQLPPKKRTRTSAGGRSEWFGEGSEYDTSFRSTQVSDDMTGAEREAILSAYVARRQAMQEESQEAPVDEKMEGIQK